MRPVIGLIPLWDEEKESCWMLPGYLRLLEDCGGLPLTLPLTTDPALLEQCLALCDGLLLTGGHDVDPALYGQKPLPQCGAPCPERDRMELWLLRRALECGKPVLGICRGLQFLNAALGGTLYQDLPTQRPGTVAHHMAPPYNRAVHRVELVPQTPLAKILGVESLGVNSYHHQAICRLAPALRPMAYSEDGLTEAAWLPQQRFVMGVQWHPEFFGGQDPAARRLTKAFVAACEKTDG